MRSGLARLRGCRWWMRRRRCNFPSLAADGWLFQRLLENHRVQHGSITFFEIGAATVFGEIRRLSRVNDVRVKIAEGTEKPGPVFVRNWICNPDGGTRLQAVRAFKVLESTFGRFFQKRDAAPNSILILGCTDCHSLGFFRARFACLREPVRGRNSICPRSFLTNSTWSPGLRQSSSRI